MILINLFSLSDFQLLLAQILQSQMLIGPSGDTAASGSSGQETLLEQIGFIYILQGDRLFSDGGSEGVQTHWAAVIKLNDAAEHPAVCGVQAKLVNLKIGRAHV